MANIDITTTPKGIDVQAQEPLELKTVKDNAADREAITVATKYDGLSVYEKDTNDTWQFQGDPDIGSWIKLVLDGFSTSEFISSSSGQVDAGKPVVLDVDGKINTSMLSSSDLSLYYLLDGQRPLTGDMDAGGFKIFNTVSSTANGDVVVHEQLSNYLSITGVAADSALLNSQTPSYYLNYTNFTGTIDAANLPNIISSDTTGSSASSIISDSWSTSRLITLIGDVAGTASIKGDTDISISTIVADNSHNHSVLNITGVNDAFNKNFGVLAGTVAEGNHTHVGSTVSTLTNGTGLLGSNYDGLTNISWDVDFGVTVNQVARGDHTHAVPTPEYSLATHTIKTGAKFYKTLIDIGGTITGLITLIYEETITGILEDGDTLFYLIGYNELQPVSSVGITVSVEDTVGSYGSVYYKSSTDQFIYHGTSIPGNSTIRFTVTYIANNTL